MRVPPDVVRLDAAVVIGLSLLLVPVAASRVWVDRWEGGLLVTARCGFLVVTAT